MKDKPSSVNHLNQKVVRALKRETGGCPQGACLEDAQLNVDQGVNSLGHVPLAIPIFKLANEEVQHPLASSTVGGGDFVAQEEGDPAAKQQKVPVTVVVKDGPEDDGPVVQQEVAILNGLPVLDVLGVRSRRSRDERGWAGVYHHLVKVVQLVLHAEVLSGSLCPEPQIHHL